VSSKPTRTIRSLRGTVILFVVAMVLVVTLTALWNVVLAVDYQRIKALMTAHQAESPDGAFHWTFIAVGSVLFVATIVLFSVLGARLFTQIRWAQRLSTFIATFTHELNSPLASIKMFAQTLQKPDLKPEERERFLKLILLDVDRLHRQISNTLASVQLDSLTGLRVDMTPVDLGPYLEDYVNRKRMTLPRQGRATLSLTRGLEVEVQLDPLTFVHVLDNLVDNAVKYGRPDGVHVEIKVVAGSRLGWVGIEVSDNGSGIPAPDLERVLEQFGRADHDAANRNQGTGLGLWIAHQVVDAHKGRLRAHSAGKDQGTTITMELPIRARAVAGGRAGELVEVTP
jgi:two-component system, OmpR family, phosphate regulon sensor histidine kinase PhoR